MAHAAMGEFSIERMERAVQLVHERLLRSTAALSCSGVRYAVCGGHAVVAWVAKMDVGGVRNTPDVDLLVRRSEFSDVKAALNRAGFVWREAAGIQNFRDGTNRGRRDAVHVIFAGEKIRPGDAYPAPKVEQTESVDEYQVIALESLVWMKLTAFRTIDRVHIRDMLDVCVIDASWLSRLPSDLATRLKELIETPDG